MPLLPPYGGKWNAIISTRFTLRRGARAGPAVEERDYIISARERPTGSVVVRALCASAASPVASPRRRRRGYALDTRSDVLAVLDDVLSLKGRSAAFGDDTHLLGGVPELDSMAVANVLASLEERFGITIDDDEIAASTFATVGSLVAYVEGKLGAAG